MNMKQKKTKATGRCRAAARRGSTLMIVMVLMGVLSLLGVLFYTFAAQERSNAEYYSEAAKESGDPGLDADALFDFALEQIIVGTNPNYKNSMLWGSRHSLLSNSLGYGLHKPNGLHPFIGEGINVIFDASGDVVVDQNRDGVADAGLSYLLDFVDSPAAQNLTERDLTNGSFPQGGVGYTYPDINNIFLCYVGKVRDQNGNVHQVVKPSYMLPGILRNPGGAPNTNWYQDATTVARSMRAHPNHLFVPTTTAQGNPVNRYLTNAQAATFGLSAGFPFMPMNPNYTTATPNPAPTVSGRMGVWTKISATQNADDPVEFDYDNDGDGVRESIIVDLGHCVRSDAAGNKYVPMFLITIHDLDALINMNAHGNVAKILFGPNDLSQAGTPVSNSGNPFGWDTTVSLFNSVSQSNLGLGPWEINPFWTLNARPTVDGSGTVFSQHTAFFGNAPSLLSGANPPWGETANMELFWSKVGRLQLSGATVQDLYAGLYGEEGLLYQAHLAGNLSAVGGQSLPRPGISMQDDDGDVSEGQALAFSTANPFGSFIHPMDFTGMGSYLSSGSAKQINWSTSGPYRWIAYNRYGSNITTPSASSNVKWGQKAGLMTNTITQGLGDSPGEVAFYASDKRDVDKPFKADEMLYLQLNNSEVDRLNVSTRLSKLVPFNFAKTTADNTRGENIRRKFTVLSNDLKNFSLPYSSSGRTWEYSIDPNSGKLVFPPQFGTIQRTSTTALAEYPFRQALRALLEVERSSTQYQQRIQRKLSINQLLTGTGLSDLDYRNLTPHPEDPGATTINTVTNVSAYPPSSAAGQEYWARRDRQLMARDIYVLLYLLGHGDDGLNVTTTSNATFTVYTEVQLREMAQFAINMVDAMDRDNVITRFEYDKDLSDGWNLDDDPFGTPESAAYLASDPAYNANYPNDSADRGEVFGIERLDLTISEGLAIQAKQATSMSNHNSTNYDESGNDRHFAYVELRNHGPFDINFDNKEAWQVVLKQDANGMNPGWERRVSLKAGSIATGGNPYVVGSTDSSTAVSMYQRSTFAVDPGWGGNPVQLAPNGKDCDLDLVEATPPGNFFRIEDENNTDITTTTGALLSAFTGPMPIGNVAAPLKIVLRRRAHPTRTRVTTTTDNPWVEVDSMTIEVAGTSGSPTQSFRIFDVGASPTAATVAPRLGTLTSRERSQPLDATTATGEAYHAETTPMANSIGNNNSNMVSPFTVWQPHFDRDYASVMDLLHVPVFGPHRVTAHMRGVIRENPTGQINSAAGIAKSAAAKFLLPEHPNNAGAMTPDRTIDNRWHRLLEFIEVPTRTNRNLGVGTPFSISRVPGRMNLNTLRFADNFAALLDESRYVTFKIDGTDMGGAAFHQVDADAGELYDNFQLTNRDWWDQFLKSRDKIDPYWASAINVSVPLPGLPGSNPFRSLADSGYTASGGTRHASIESTILRSLPADSSVAGSKRRLLEVGNSAEHTNGNIDPLIRHRILSKIAGNTTTRSNCFAIFISVKYFEAAEDSTTNPQIPAIRIGGPVSGTPEPEHRGFFIVDRSKLENGQTSGGSSYDFRDFIEYRKTLKTQ